MLYYLSSFKCMFVPLPLYDDIRIINEALINMQLFLFCSDSSLFDYHWLYTFFIHELTVCIHLGKFIINNLLGKDIELYNTCRHAHMLQMWSQSYLLNSYNYLHYSVKNKKLHVHTHYKYTHKVTYFILIIIKFFLKRI